MAKKSIRAAVAGGGNWGTALAHVLACAGHEVNIVLRDEAVARAINETHEIHATSRGAPCTPTSKPPLPPMPLRTVSFLSLPCPASISASG